MMRTVISVRRSHFEEVGDSHSECHRAVFAMNGNLGIRRRSRAEGESSIVVAVIGCISFVKIYTSQDGERKINEPHAPAYKQEKAASYAHSQPSLLPGGVCNFPYVMTTMNLGAPSSQSHSVWFNARAVI